MSTTKQFGARAAMTALKKGKRIGHKSWRGGEYCYLDDVGNLRDERGDIYYHSGIDILGWLKSVDSFYSTSPRTNGFFIVSKKLP